MKLSYKTVFLTLLGILLGASIVTVLKGLWGDEFDWEQWLVFMAGGISGGLIMLFFVLISNKIGKRRKDS
ncbi:hypothetical protein [Lentibacillus sp. Marseille-P4043]|uniref:hypothetical protein n=1 Tax=Lentibacillus sp. Marseille-P4043 TaxID=2040293 RepID=UPI000D0BD1FE|nr:hypothetical protein [Lentibacillus sp. Marseille-P4043]